MKIVGCGMSGLVGNSLLKKLEQCGYDVTLLKRKLSGDKTSSYQEVLWDGRTVGDWKSTINGADAVINLSGEPIAGKRWTFAQKKELINSRIATTKAIVNAIALSDRKPKVLINASAIGFYGSRENTTVNENSAPGLGFLPDLCKEWERQAKKAESLGVRVVMLRTGIVLSKKGGALKTMLPPFQLGLGGPLGSGNQFFSWIHIDDEVGAILSALENASLFGPVNLTAPEPVTMKVFSTTLAKTLGRPAFFAVPEPVLKTLLGEMADMLLADQNVMPQKLLSSGYHFKYSRLDAALADLLKK